MAAVQPPERPEHPPLSAGPPPPPPPTGLVPPPPPAGLAASVELRISKRTLWIGRAAYPLHNIARVHTFTLRPKRKEAVLRFVKRVGMTVAVAVIISLPAAIGSALSEGSSPLLGWLWFLALGVVALCGVDLITVLTAKSYYVLAVETAGASTGVVTSVHPHHLDRLVGDISHAIDHPETEFRVTVECITHSPNNYYFGDNVNMYGGSGNVGKAA
ncbi:DUF6232 family protein [Streptomyces sp. NPDC052077]|uniref:DUF6232 family protein n=1 Tax=Streptomyces sp. NPDC052077 TaxID=3154757 RepID=UPI00343AE7AC